ncbi:methyltransferase domain-containing protein [Aeromicrobium sp.]|uniref:methyltransferase domain-containing protein n=1 Tax=Aeromicrobium sp. TaxID=1871063 RepID=UPI003D6BCEDA
MTPEEKTAGCVDLGCGAGELLYYFSDHAKVDMGIDYSQSMLDVAHRRLDGKSIALSDVDAFTYLPECTSPTWVTTGALNQFLSSHRLADLMDLFTVNESARSFYLFDCVDPVRYAMLPCGIGYQPMKVSERKPLSRLMRRSLRTVGRLLRMAQIVLLPRKQREWARLPGEGMGFGYLPSFWLHQADVHQLSIEIVSSRYYEYRYHVILRKPGFDG